MTVKRLLLLTLIFVSTLVSVAFLVQPTSTPPQSLPGAIPVKMPQGGGFVLSSGKGQVSLEDFHGQVLLLYFGYTFCPDICPTSLALAAEALKGLSPTEQKKVRLLFISVDPGRDTPVTTNQYAHFFHPDFMGATGAPEELADIARRYGVIYQIQPPTQPGGSYVVDHSADIYVVSKSGELVTRIPHAASPEEAARILRSYL